MTSRSNPIRILIMEDDPGIARLLQKRLQGAGYEATIARDGKEGLDMYEAGSYHLVAVDHAMPEHNGLEVMRALAARGPLPPTIMVTGKGSEGVAVEAMKLGASDYIVKDVDGGFLDLLPGVIEKVLERQDLIKKGKKAEEALRKSEERYRDLYENAPNTYFSIRMDGSIFRCNATTARLLDMDKEKIIGITFFDLFADTPHGKPKAVEILKHLKEGKPIKDMELEISVRGTLRWISLSVEPVMDRDGHVVAGRSIMIDISERKGLEEQLLQTHKLKAMGTFAGGIAHDFNNLLAVIVGNIDLSKSYAKKDSELERFLSEAQKASLHAKDLTQKFLIFASGGKPVTRAESISNLLEDTANLALSGSNVIARFSHSEDISLVDLDEGQIKQVINNLITNARESMPQGGTIHVITENVRLKPGDVPGLGEGKYVKVSVIDGGTGIAEEILGKVFDPYFTTKGMGSQKGLGLGLTICHSIISQHNGHVGVTSRKGTGTTFYFYLPASAEKAVAAKRTKSASPERTPILGKGRILVMDDEEMLRRLAEQMLIRLGYETTTVQNGIEAVQAFKDQQDSNHPFDAVLLDLTIKGGMGGREVIKELLQIDPHVKAIILSGYFNDPVMANFRDYGFCAAIPKPFQMKDLREILSTILEPPT